MLQPFATGIWIADGPEVDAMLGFRYPTRMAVIRLTGGDLFVWSPVALDEALRLTVDALGSVRHIVAPNSLHHLYLADWIAAYPDAAVYAAPGLREKRDDIQFTGELGDQPEPAWAGRIDQVVVRSNAITTEVVFFHAASATVLFTDLVQHLPADWFSGWRSVVARLDLITAQEPSVPRKFRVAFTNRNDARASVRRILSWPAERVVMAHGAPVTQEGKATLARAFRWLKV